MPWQERMRDSAEAASIPADYTGIVGGYPGAFGDPFHVWTAGDWARFPRNRKLPIFVNTNPQHPEDDAFAAIRVLHFLGVPAGRGIFTALDLETAVSPGYVAAYGATMRWAGFKVWPYGSASAIFGNPPLNGYWVADYLGIGPFMYDNPETVATQYANPATGSGGPWDSSTVRIAEQNGAWWV
jgi:hypothetical protein